MVAIPERRDCPEIDNRELPVSLPWCRIAMEVLFEQMENAPASQ